MASVRHLFNPCLVGGGRRGRVAVGAPNNALVQPDGRLYSTRGFCPFDPSPVDSFMPRDGPLIVPLR